MQLKKAIHHFPEDYRRLIIRARVDNGRRFWHLEGRENVHFSTIIFFRIHFIEVKDNDTSLQLKSLYWRRLLLNLLKLNNKWKPIRICIMSIKITSIRAYDECFKTYFIDLVTGNETIQLRPFSMMPMDRRNERRHWCVECYCLSTTPLLALQRKKHSIEKRNLVVVGGRCTEASTGWKINLKN